MDTNVNTNAVFAAFIEADKALKELPEVRAKLETTEAVLAEADADIAAKAKLIADREARIAQLEADLAAKEAALTDATKSRDEHANLLHGLRGLLGASPVAAVTESEAKSESTTTAEPTDTTMGKSEPTSVTPTDPVPFVSGEQHGSDAHTGSAGFFEAAANTVATLEPVPAEEVNTATTPAFPPDIRQGHELNSPIEAKQPASAKPYWVTWNDWAEYHNGEVPDYITDRTKV